MDLIERVTKDLSYLIYYPFLALGLLSISRLPFFDNWTFALPLVTVMLASSTLLAYAAISLRRDAGRARREVRERLHKRLVGVLEHRPQLHGAHQHVLDPVVEEKTYRQAIDDVDHMREGAFRPLIKEPIIESLGGISGLLLLQQIMLPYL